MIKQFAVGICLLATGACRGGEVEVFTSEPLAEPTIEFEVIVPEVDTDWPLAEDTDGN
jgi:hypothetical protein